MKNSVDNNHGTNDEVKNQESLRNINYRVEWNVLITRPYISIPDYNAYYKNVYKRLLKLSKSHLQQNVYISEISTMNTFPYTRVNFSSKNMFTIEDKCGLQQINQYKIHQTLGKGSHGLVKLVEDYDGHLSALKIISKKKLMKSNGYYGFLSPMKITKPLQRIYQEIAIYKKLNHPNIVKLLEVIDEPDQNNLYMIFEHVDGGPIMDVGVSDPLNEDLARRYFRDIICGLEYLHFNKIIHRDIKPANLLVDKNGVVKIIDFGVSCQFTGDDIYLQDTVGSPAFLAPESVQYCYGKFKGKALDIWAFGMTLHCFLFGKIAFDSRNKIDLYYSIATKAVILPKKPVISTKACDLLRKMLNKDPKERIKLDKIKIHPWVIDNKNLSLQFQNQQSCQQIETISNKIKQRSIKFVHIHTIVSALMMIKRRSFKNPKSELQLQNIVLDCKEERMLIKF